MNGKKCEEEKVRRTLFSYPKSATPNINALANRRSVYAVGCSPCHNREVCKHRHICLFCLFLYQLFFSSSYIMLELFSFDNFFTISSKGIHLDSVFLYLFLVSVAGRGVKAK